MQLVKSVLNSIQWFLSSAFILPKIVIKKVTSLMSQFIWAGDLKQHYCSKVKLSDICLPYKKGGLNFYNFKNWNKWLIMKLIWNIRSRKEFLLVKWIHTINLKHTSFWGYKVPTECSWIWRNFLKLRELTQGMIMKVVGDTEDTWFWYDNWHPLGHLCMKFTGNIQTNLGLSKNDRVSKCIKNDNWNWPIGRKWQMKWLSWINPCSFITCQWKKNHIYWKESENGVNIVNSAMKFFSGNAENVGWYKLVWSKDHIHRYSFIFWPACKRRLTAKDRMKSWGISIGSTTCVLCNHLEESIEHLHFECALTSAVWKKVLKFCSIYEGLYPWRVELEWVCTTWRSDSFADKFQRLMLAANIYQI